MADSLRWRRASRLIDDRREGVVECRIAVGQTLRRGAEEGEAGDELEGVDAAAHQVFERKAAGELVADGGGDFFVAGAEERVAQVIARFREIADARISQPSRSGRGRRAAGRYTRSNGWFCGRGVSPPARSRSRRAGQPGLRGNGRGTWKRISNADCGSGKRKVVESGSFRSAWTRAQRLLTICRRADNLREGRLPLLLLQ